MAIPPHSGMGAESDERGRATKCWASATQVGTTDRVDDRDACIVSRHIIPPTLTFNPGTMSELLAEIRKIPPVTRFVCASIVAVTLPVMTKTISPYTMIFVKEFVTKKYEVRFRSAIPACRD